MTPPVARLHVRGWWRRAAAWLSSGAGEPATRYCPRCHRPIARDSIFAELVGAQEIRGQGILGICATRIDDGVRDGRCYPSVALGPLRD